MMPARYTALEERVLVLMPSAQDAERTVRLLTEHDVACAVCAELAVLCRELRFGAGVVLLADESVLGDREGRLERALQEQPAWSAVPVIVLARERVAQRMASSRTESYRNIVVVERPVRAHSLISVVGSALRARRSQYEIRDAIRERERQASELLAQDERLRTADRLKDEFLATLAHELRNPLAPIRTGLQLLSDSPDPELSRMTLGMMQRQVGHMVRLIDDLLDVSRITRGKLELKRERISVASVVEAAVEGSLPNLQRGQHTLHRDLTTEQLFLDADHTRIAQAISNLLNNASKYTPNGGVIALSTRRDGTQLSISVADSGVGIPVERLDDVFGMFSQVNRELDRSQGGLGIGLALVRRLVEMHGGTATAWSEGPGLGSTFTIRLPLADDEPVNVQTVVEAVSTVPSDSRILVVDDNDDAAELLARSLQQAGYETTVAHDGAGAVEAVTASKPDFVILDIGLPDMDGYQVAQQLRREPSLAHTALIALTGWGTADDRRRALAAGFDVHLTKPVASGDLREAMGRAAQLRRTPRAG